MSGEATSTSSGKGSRSNETYAALCADIESGRYKVGDFLPSIRTIAKQFGVSISPVMRAIEKLESEGMIERIHGSGIRLAASPVSSDTVRRTNIVVPTVSPPTEQAAYGEVLSDKDHDYPFLAQGEEWLRRHVCYAGQEWLIHKLLHQRGHGIQLMPISVDAEDKGFATLLEELLESPPRALCFAAPENFGDREYESLLELKKRQVKIACLVSARYAADFDRVVLDFEGGQYALTRYLAEQGHQNIVRLVSNGGYDWERRKQLGFEKAILESGVSKKKAKDYCFEIGEIQGSGAEVVGRMIRFVGEIIDKCQPTVIMAVNDSYAALLRVVLKFLGQNDIVVTGYDNMWRELDEPDPFRLGELSKSFPDDIDPDSPPISVDRRIPMAGSSLAKLVLDRVNGYLPDEPQEVTIPQDLVLPE